MAERGPGPQLSFQDALAIVRAELYKTMGGGQTLTPEAFTGQGLDREYRRTTGPFVGGVDEQLSRMTPEQVRTQALQALSTMSPQERRRISPSADAAYENTVRQANLPPIVHTPPPPMAAEVESDATTSRSILQSLNADMAGAYNEFMRSQRTIADAQGWQEKIGAIAGAYLADDQVMNDPGLTQAVTSRYIIDSRAAANRAEAISQGRSQDIQEAASFLNYDINLKNAAIAAKRLEAENYFQARQIDEIALPKLLLDQRKFGLDIDNSKWAKAVDTYKMIWEDFKFQTETQFQRAGVLEGISQFETNRMDKAREILTRLDQGFSSLIANNAERISQASIAAGNQFIQLLPKLITPEMESRYIPGFEPGGPSEYMAKLAGYQFTPMTYGQSIRGSFDPFAQVNELKGSLARSEDLYPRPTLDQLAPSRYSPGLDALESGLGAESYSPSLPLFDSIVGMGSPSEWTYRED